MAGNRKVLDHMGSEEDGTRKKMAGNGGTERRAGRSWPGPLPLMLHITASRGASRWSQRSEQARFCFLGEGVRGLQFPRDSEGESKETQDSRFLHTTTRAERAARNFHSFPGQNSRSIQTTEFEPQIPNSVIPSLNSYIQTQPAN
jgi:hypothetical protein